MLRVVLLDLGEPATDGRAHHLTDALDALPRFTTAAGRMLAWSVVRPSAQDDGEPDDESTRAAYHRTIASLGVGAELDECVVIADDDERIATARRLGATPVQFCRAPLPASPPSDPARAPVPAFTDWLDGLLLIRVLIAPHSRESAKAALAPWFSARGAHLTSIDGDVDAAAVTVRLRIATANPDGAGPEPAHQTVTSRITFDHDGHVVAVTPVATLEDRATDENPTSDERSERATFRACLRAGGVLTTADAPTLSGATHIDRIDETGELVVRRTRFSAV
jgi:hypothetical protein